MAVAWVQSLVQELLHTMAMPPPQFFFKENFFNSIKWNHSASDLLRLALFTQPDALEIPEGTQKTDENPISCLSRFELWRVGPRLLFADRFPPGGGQS